MTAQRRRPPRRGVAAAVATIAVLAVGACAPAEQEAQPPPTSAAPSSTTTTVAPTTTTTAPGRQPPPAWTVTAVTKGSVQGYSAPNGAPTAMVTGEYYGWSTALPVREEQGDWVRVGTPYKPNSSSAWVRKQDVTLGMTPWHIEIDVTTAHLRLFKEGEQVLDAAVGIGTDYTPTAVGDFFVTHFQDPPDGGYGPFVMVTSGHSEVLQSFGGFPDGILAIHGPIGSEWAFAGVGARISNGCVRMTVQDQQQLAAVTPGSPVTIYASPPPPPPPDDPGDGDPPGTTAGTTTGGAGTTTGGAGTTPG